MGNYKAETALTPKINQPITFLAPLISLPFSVSVSAVDVRVSSEILSTNNRAFCAKSDKWLFKKFIAVYTYDANVCCRAVSAQAILASLFASAQVTTKLLFLHSNSLTQSPVYLSGVPVFVWTLCTKRLTIPAQSFTIYRVTNTRILLKKGFIIVNSFNVCQDWKRNRFLRQQPVLFLILSARCGKMWLPSLPDQY